MTGRQHNGASKAPWELFFLLLLLTDRWEGCTTLAHQCARAVFVFFFILRPRRCSHQPSLGGPSLTDSRPRFTQSNIYSIVLLSVLLYHGIVLLPQKEKKGSITVDVKRIKILIAFLFWPKVQSLLSFWWHRDDDLTFSEVTSSWSSSGATFSREAQGRLAATIAVLFTLNATFQVFQVHELKWTYVALARTLDSKACHLNYIKSCTSPLERDKHQVGSKRNLTCCVCMIGGVKSWNE